MKRALLMALLLAGTTQLQAGNLEAEHIGCKGAHNLYILNWYGPWQYTPIYLERTQSFSGP